jgi:hypothetical protein
MKKFIVALFVLSLLCTPAFALVCEMSQSATGSDACWTQVTIASDETTLVSIGTVLVANYNNLSGATSKGSYEVQVATASADGARVMGVAQRSIVTGDSALIQVRGKGKVAVKTTEAIASGDQLFVSTSGDASVVTSTTLSGIGFALEAGAVSGNTRTTKDVYIRIK